MSCITNVLRSMGLGGCKIVATEKRLQPFITSVCEVKGWFLML